MYLPDKYSWLEAWNWWLESNRIFEPKIRQAATVKEFLEGVREEKRTGNKNGNHYIYLMAQEKKDEKSHR